MTRRLLVALLVLIGAVVVPGVAEAKRKPTTCDLLTKKQVSKILDHKVVKTALRSDKKTGAAECEYRTNFYQSARMKRIGAPYKLQVTTQPITGIESDVARLASDSDSRVVTDLGDRAFYTSGNALIVVIGDLVLQTEVTNVEWSGNELDTLIRIPEREAMDLLVPLFRSVSPSD